MIARIVVLRCIARKKCMHATRRPPPDCINFRRLSILKALRRPSPLNFAGGAGQASLAMTWRRARSPPRRRSFLCPLNWPSSPLTPALPWPRRQRTCTASPPRSQEPCPARRRAKPSFPDGHLSCAFHPPTDRRPCIYWQSLDLVATCTDKHLRADVWLFLFYSLVLLSFISVFIADVKFNLHCGRSRQGIGQNLEAASV